MKTIVVVASAAVSAAAGALVAWQAQAVELSLPPLVAWAVAAWVVSVLSCVTDTTARLAALATKTDCSPDQLLLTGELAYRQSAVAGWFGVLAGSAPSIVWTLVGAPATTAVLLVAAILVVGASPWIAWRSAVRLMRLEAHMARYGLSRAEVKYRARLELALDVADSLCIGIVPLFVAAVAVTSTLDATSVSLAVAAGAVAKSAACLSAQGRKALAAWAMKKR